MAEMVARVEAACRRRHNPAGSAGKLRIGQLVLDPLIAQARGTDGVLPLSWREFTLLYYLACRLDRVIPAEEIFDEAWPNRDDSDVGLLKTTVYRLRQKLADAQSGLELRTVRGQGYLLTKP
jgi:DNA-binding response OmpR family regulator